jgi:hypothetical protein
MGTGSFITSGNLNISIDIVNHRGWVIDTGAGIAAVTAAAGGKAGMWAFCIGTGSNFTQDNAYTRKTANDGWYAVTLTISGTKVTGTT